MSCIIAYHKNKPFNTSTTLLSIIPTSDTNNLYFELPESPIRGIPLYSSNGEQLSFSFLEVGCNPRGKCKQLQCKRELFHKFWGDNYRRRANGIDWNPLVYRCLSHYGKHDSISVGRRKFEVDVVLNYEHITPEMLDHLDEGDKLKIFKKVKSESKKKELLEQILTNRDGEYLHRLITEGGSDPSQSMLRGTMAEVLALKDLELSLPTGMSLYKNGDIKYFNQRYRNGTEIDGIMTFYQEIQFMQLLDNLRNIPHLNVRDRWSKYK